MKQLFGFFLFLLVFLAGGVVMHLVLYEKPGVFVWAPEKDEETGEWRFVRTTLMPLVVERAPGEPETETATKEPDEAEENSEPATEKEGAEEGGAAEATDEATAPDEGEQREIALFDGEGLGTWEKTQYGGEGDVFVDEEGNLEFGFGAVITGVHWGDEPPALSNYEISLDAMKLDGHDFFLALTFPVKDSHATFVIGGWGGGVVGISSVDDLNASENETMNIEGFENDRWYEVRVRVTDEKIEAWIDEDQMVDLELEDRKISLLPGDIELSVPIGLAAYQTRAQYRNIVWRNLPAAE